MPPDKPTVATPPFFTVIVPLYNKAAHIEATLATLTAQRWPGFEIVVVDDGSTDDGPARVIAASLPGLRLVTQANAGPGAARNRGIAEARGDWIAFLDADDRWFDYHLAECAAVIAALPASDVVATRFVRAEKGDATVFDAPRDRGAVRTGDFIADAEQVWTSCVAVRTAVARSSGGFGRVWPGEDVEFWFRLSLGCRLGVSSRVTAVYVQQTGGAMDSGAGTQPEVGTVLDQPIFVAMAGALAGPLDPAVRARIERHRCDLLRDWTRPCLFAGRTRTARAYLAALRGFGGRAPVAYTLLSLLPGGALRWTLRRYGAVRRRLTA